ncbi:MAG: DUF5009 domain-containing protein [Ignavibacteria bacterium]|jgi:predicted acyltransferase
MIVEKPGRLMSLDVFRGATIAGMILVNNPGNADVVFPELAHSQWNGCTFADFIFPLFLFIMGVAITLALSKRKERGDNQGKLLLQIFKRSVIIFILGLILGIFPKFDFGNIVFTGVLKKIAIVYFFASLIFLKTNIKTQAIITGSILLIYWGFLALIPLPGIGSEPVTLLGEQFNKLLMSGQVSHGFMESLWFINTLTSVCSALLGVLTGHLMKSGKDEITKTLYMFVVGNILLLAGYLWDWWFPINRYFWSSSYVLYTGGFALNFFALCYWLIDIKKYKKWSFPFLVFGMNAITFYFFAVIVRRYLKFITVSDVAGNIVNLRTYLFESIFLPFFDPSNASLIWSLSYLVVWFFLMWILYAKKIFIKV